MKKSFKHLMAAAFIAAGCLFMAPAQVKADTAFVTVTPAKTDCRDNYEAAIDANEDAAQGSTISLVKEKGKDTVLTHTYFSFTLPESGLVSLRYSLNVGNDGDNLRAIFTLYSNKTMTNIKLDAVELYGTRTEEELVFLNKGTYYIEVMAKDDYWQEDIKVENRVGVAAAYVPVEGKTTDFTVKYSTTASTTSPVTVTIITADPDAGIWCQEGVVQSYLVNNDITWSEDSHCIDKTFTVKQNGTYTVRIKDSLGNCEQRVIKISNIDTTKPMTPVVKTYKKDTTAVKGTAEAGTRVYVKIGTKTYNTVALDDGSWSVKTAKLAAGDKITVTAKDAAGNKSKSKSYTVKK